MKTILKSRSKLGGIAGQKNIFILAGPPQLTHCFPYPPAQATELKPCGANGDFEAGKVECATFNGADAESNGWHLVRRTKDKSCHQDSETKTVWSPTHAYYPNGKKENGGVANFRIQYISQLFSS